MIPHKGFIVMNTEAVEQIVLEVLRSRMPEVTFTAVKAERDVDSDGQDVMKIAVVFEAASDLDASKVAGLIRHMRPAMNKQGETSFPIMSFISKKEAQKAGLAAA